MGYHGDVLVTAIHAMSGAGLGRPAFLDAGSGTNQVPQTGNIEIPYPGTVAAGNILVAYGIANDASGGSVLLPGGWTSIGGGVTSIDGFFGANCFWKTATGSESGTLSVSAFGSTYVAGRMYRFTRGTGIESATQAETDASSATISMVNLTLGNTKGLAVQIYSIQANTTVGDPTGESNVDYLEAVAEYAGTSFGCLGISVGIPTSTSLTGGSITAGAAGTYRTRIGFGIQF